MIQNETESMKCMCIQQANMMTEIAMTQFKNHFPRWADSLIIYGIASEKQTAKVVADFLRGNSLD